MLNYAEKLKQIIIGEYDAFTKKTVLGLLIFIHYAAGKLRAISTSVNHVEH